MPSDSAQLLQEAAGLAEEAHEMAERHAAFAAALAATAKSVTGLADPLVLADRQDIAAKWIVPARAAAAPERRDFAAAMAMLAKAEAEIAGLAAYLEHYRTFAAKHAEAQKSLDQVGTAQDKHIGAAIAELQATRLDAAKALAAPPARDIGGGEKLLAGFARECQALALRRGIQADGKPPKKEDMLALMQDPEGMQALDRAVLALPDDKDGSVSTAVMEAAIAARFGLASVKQDGLKEKEFMNVRTLKKMYEVLTKCPSSHTLDNPSMAAIERTRGTFDYLKWSANHLQDNASYFGKSEYKLVLNVGRPTDREVTKLAHPVELIEIDPECEPAPGPDPKFFGWTILHELAHAIDDNKRFMDSNGAGAAFGGWQSHKDVTPVAAAIAAATRFDSDEARAEILAQLLGKKYVKAPAPSARSDWDQCRAAAVEWCGAIREGNELWNNGGNSAKYSHDGRVYHEAYGGQWVSYNLAARSKGITGYQFRSPGEWISELYAAYHSGKLKESHPAVKWLATL